MTSHYHLRRKDREIVDPVEIDSILARGRFVTLALADSGEPYVVTLSYGHDAAADRLYFHVAHEGHKLDIITRNARACGTVVIESGYTQGECEHPFESVVMRGTMRVVSDPDEKVHAIRTLVEHLEDDPAGYWESRSWALSDRVAGFSALAFDIESLTAKRGK